MSMRLIHNTLEIDFGNSFSIDDKFSEFEKEFSEMLNNGVESIKFGSQNKQSNAGWMCWIEMLVKGDDLGEAKFIFNKLQGDSIFWDKKINFIDKLYQSDNKKYAMFCVDLMQTILKKSQHQLSLTQIEKARQFLNTVDPTASQIFDVPTEEVEFSVRQGM